MLWDKKYIWLATVHNFVYSIWSADWNVLSSFDPYSIFSVKPLKLYFTQEKAL